MMKIVTMVVALGVTAFPALGACDSDTIDVVASDGEILITASGQMYHVLPGYDRYSMMWLPAETIIICDDGIMKFPEESYAIYAIINMDENREHVAAVKGQQSR